MSYQYEYAMGTEDAQATAVEISFEDFETPSSRAEIAQRQTEREAERQRELDTMWQTGRWRETAMFDRWLHHNLGPERTGGGYMSLVTGGPIMWMSSAHCLFAAPAGEECSNYAGREKKTALPIFLWPIATAYFAWRKSEEQPKWAAIGGAAGMLTAPLAWIASFLLFGDKSGGW